MISQEIIPAYEKELKCRVATDKAVPLLSSTLVSSYFFFFQAEDGIRDSSVTGVQTCALPISVVEHAPIRRGEEIGAALGRAQIRLQAKHRLAIGPLARPEGIAGRNVKCLSEIGRASCRERV